MNRRDRATLRWWIAAGAACVLLAAASIASWRHARVVDVHGAAEEAASERSRLRQGWSEGSSASARGILEGTVVSGGAPVAEAVVCATCAGCDQADLETAPLCTRTRHDGRYALDARRWEAVLVSATAKGHAPGLANEGRPITRGAQAGDDPEYDIQLMRGGARISGKVVDATGGPVAEATVLALFSADGSMGASLLTQATSTDPEGKFVLWGAPGLVKLTASATGYAPATAARRAPTSDLELRVIPEAQIRGKVVTENGTPVEDLRVVASMGLSASRQGSTDASGAFTVSGLQPGTYELRASGEKWIGDLPRSVTLDLGDVVDDVVLKVRRAASVDGKLLVGDRACRSGRVMLGPRAQDSSVPTLSAATKLRGEVHFEAVPAGTYQVMLSCAGYEPQHPEDFVVDDDQVEDVTWRLQPGLQVAGSVRDHVGRPIAKLQLHLSPRAPDGYASDALTDAEGNFRFRGVRSGSYTIEVENADVAAPLAVDVKRDDLTDLRIVARAAGRLSVRVVSPRGEPVDGISVNATSADGRSPLPPEELGNGIYQYTALAAGKYAVRVHDGVNPPVEAGGPGGLIEVSAGRDHQIEVKVGGHAGRITGYVRDDEGAPLANVWVRATPGPSGDLGAQLQEFRMLEESRRSLTDDEGAFEIEGLSEKGRFVVIAERPLGGQTQLRDVAAGARIELRLEALGSLAGTALGPNGSPLERFILTLTNERTGQQRSEVVSHPDGRWRIDDLTPGPIRIMALDPRGNLADVTETLLPKQRRDGVRIHLREPAATPSNDVSLGAGALPDTQP